MTGIGAARDAGPPDWLLSADVDWWNLVRCGPPGLETYVRVEVVDHEDHDGEHPALRVALETLAGHTGTPERAYAAVWEGWGGTGPEPEAPAVLIPHRRMLLFTGPVLLLRDAPALAWQGTAEGSYQEPHLVWPKDRAWCVACEVDEEIEFTVGCPLEASQSLVRALPGKVRSMTYGSPGPLYRDDA